MKKIKTLHKTKLAVFNGHKSIKLALQHTYVLKMVDRAGKMSWTAEVSLFFVSCQLFVQLYTLVSLVFNFLCVCQKVLLL